MNTLIGTRHLVRLALRRDRFLLPIWILLFAILPYSSAAATISLYTTPESMIEPAQAVNDSPALLALYGRIYDVTSVGAVSLFKLNAFGAALVAIFAIILMVRHTRGEEEAGRLELVGATVIGRHASLAAAFLVTVGTVVTLGLLTAVFLIGAGLSATGSIAFGLAWAAVGTAFAAVAGITAQVTSSARAATGMAISLLGLAYVLRAVGDAGSPSWLGWLSPVGWGQHVRAYQGERWWVLLLPVVFAVALTAVGFVLVQRRDHGAGLFPDRLGPESAAAMLGRPLGLAWRLQRGSLYGWLFAFLFLGLLFGNLAANVSTFLNTPNAQELLQRLGGVQGLTDSFISTELSFVGIAAAAYGVQAALRLRSEEAALRSESILATGVSRLGWASSHVIVALFGTAVLLAGAGLAAGLTHSAATGHAEDLWRVFAAAVVRVPAAWVLVGIAVAVFGLAPRWALAGWIALVAFLVLGEFGPLFELPETVMDISPFAHSPSLPGGSFSAVPVVALVVVAAALVALGFAGFRRRDVPVT
jgi:polyether ionophore transport system permease protein